FFFQAEDGIRDFHVTGVQTCALPICAKKRETKSTPRRSDAAVTITPRVGIERSRPRSGARARTSASESSRTSRSIRFPPTYRGRSEERRVGKESRWRRARGQRQRHAE